MDMTVDKIVTVRIASMAAAGLICLAYGLALLSGERLPGGTWLPGVAGLSAAALVFLASWAAGRQRARAAADETYRQDWRRAQQHSYWVALALFSTLTVPVAFDMIPGAMALGAGGLLSAAALLLLSAIYDFRGR